MTTRPSAGADPLEQALAWHLRLRDADENAWLEFTEWLESDPAHNDAYEEIAARDADLDEAIALAEFPSPAAEDVPPEPADDEVPGFAGNRWRWGALAASLVAAVLLVTQMLSGGSDPYTITTQPGETRTIALADGGEIMLNGASEIVLDHDNARIAELRSGEALFTIVHDEANPFTVSVGESRLVDIGTVFNVVHDDDLLRVAVAEGAVRYEGGRTVDLAAGEGMERTAGGNIVVRPHDVAGIGSWSDGVLVYQATPLSQIVGDLERSTGIVVTIAPELSARRFSGVIQTTGEPAEVRQRLESLLSLQVEESDTGWTIHP